MVKILLRVSALNLVVALTLPTFRPGVVLAQASSRSAQGFSGSVNEGALEQVTESVAETIAGTAAPTPFRERLKGILDLAISIWEKEIPGTGEYRLTLQKIFVSIVLLFLGIVVSRRVTRWIHKQVLSHPRIDPHVAAATEKAVYYFLVLMVLLISLRIVSVPLTVFTLFGGALAIGIGFGAQNLINNFISGVILMLERPIRINDVVEVDGQQGRIASIGARCSRVRLFSGVDILVPNSVFLEKTVTNWTLSDPNVRFSVAVGVAYGSPTRHVAELMTQAVTEHQSVLRDPAPIVVFADFGESALVFQAYFWIEMTSTTNALVICSDIRFRIEELLRQNNITIAFPQRDVHVQSLAPIAVRVLPPEREQVYNANPANPHIGT